MHSDDIAGRAALLEKVAREAGASALDLFRRRAELAVEQKADPRDIVSRADREVETMIRAAVTASFPHDGFLGEELGHQPGNSGYLWVIDPIDGTTPFLFGQPTWCTAIAVRRDDVTLAGAIAVPTEGSLFLARRGGGAWLDGARLAMDPGLAVRSGLTAIGASHRTDPARVGALIERLMQRGGMFYRNGSGALMLAYVAAGRLAGYFEEHMHPWDSLAGLLLVDEAGGRTAPYPDGALEDGGRVLAAGPGAWDALQEIVDGPEGAAAQAATP